MRYYFLVTGGQTAFTKCVQSQVNHAKYHSQISQQTDNQKNGEISKLKSGVALVVNFV